MNLFKKLLCKVFYAIFLFSINSKFWLNSASIYTADFTLILIKKITIVMTLYLLSIKSRMVLGNCPAGLISRGRCFVSTVFSISTYKGNLYFLAHYLGTPSSLLVLRLRFTLRPYEILIGFPFSSLSISVWLSVLGSIKVLWDRLLN